MKFGPKEIKELNEYLRTGRNRKREFLGGGITFASAYIQLLSSVLTNANTL